MIVFGNTTLSDDVKTWSFAKLKRTFEGKLDYVSLAKELGIKEEPSDGGSAKRGGRKK